MSLRKATGRVALAVLAVIVILGPVDRVLAADARPSALPGSTHAMLRGPALAWAKTTAQALFPRQAPEVWAAVCTPGSKQPAGHAFHILVACAPHDAAQPGWTWTRPPDIAAARPAAEAWLRAAADAVAAVRQIPTPPRTFHSRPAEASPSMAQLWRDGCTANALLRDHFNHAVGPPGNPNLFKEWAMRVPVVGLPPDTSSASCSGRFDLPYSIARRPFLFHAARFDPPNTVAAPPIPAQVSDYRPASVDILTLEALREMYHWFRRELNDLLAYSQDPPRRHSTNKPLVIDQSGFLAPARGLFWDLTTNPPSLMRRDRSAAPRLNAAAILAAAGADYPDKELLDAIQHGVCMPTDFQLLIVLNPGVLSLADGMPQIAADIARMEAAGMLTVHTFLPFVPGVLLPQGTTGKQNKPTLRRRITDAGAPRAPLTSRDGTEVVPFNEGVRVPLPDGRSRMQPEEKPASDVTVNDSGNLAYVARAMALDGFAPDEYLAYLACDDFKALFNQFVLHPSEWSSFCLAFLRGEDLYVASERVLGFGCAPSSGIA
jgi:hypothetical protein